MKAKLVVSYEGDIEVSFDVLEFVNSIEDAIYLEEIFDIFAQGKDNLIDHLEECEVSYSWQRA